VLANGAVYQGDWLLQDETKDGRGV
jgi:hypothetical protein